MAQELSITVLGAASCTPEAGRETASFCINGRLLVDTGWNVVARLTACGIDPLEIREVLVTHCHHDHYMGIVSLLFAQGLRQSGTSEKLPLSVFGPAGEVGRVVTDAWRFLQTDRYPHLEVPVEIGDVVPGDELDLEGLRVLAARALHNVPSLHYRVTSAGGAAVTFSGDTPYSPGLVELARGSELLIHEASHGPNSTRAVADAAHSGAPDAAHIAAEAGVGRLGLVHLSQRAAEDALAAARAIFAETFLPIEGEVLRPGTIASREV